jgi:hypothetical protein
MARHNAAHLGEILGEMRATRSKPTDAGNAGVLSRRTAMRSSFSAGEKSIK